MNIAPSSADAIFTNENGPGITRSSFALLASCLAFYIFFRADYIGISSEIQRIYDDYDGLLARMTRWRYTPSLLLEIAVSRDRPIPPRVDRQL